MSCSSSGPTTCAATPARSPSPAARSTRATTDQVAAALREAVEETGLDPARRRRSFATLPAALPAAQRLRRDAGARLVAQPSPVTVVDPREVASVHRVPLADAAGPGQPAAGAATRAATSAPRSGVGDLLVWGFTAGLLDRLLRLGRLGTAVGPTPTSGDLPPSCGDVRPDRGERGELA